MAVIEPIAKDAEGRRGYRVTNPASLEVIGEFRVETADDLRVRVPRARKAQAAWAKRSVKERAEIIQNALDLLVERKEEIIDTSVAVTRRGRNETHLMEIIPSSDYMAWFARRARVMYKDRKVGN